MSRNLCARCRKICKQMCRKAVRRSLCGVALSRTFFSLKFLAFLPYRQRGKPKGEKGEEQIKPDKNRHFLPLFPLSFSPLDSPFLNPLFPLLCRFFPALLSCDPSVKIARLPLAGSFVRRPTFYGSQHISLYREMIHKK